jgi:predicted nucleotidyltransferase
MTVAVDTEAERMIVDAVHGAVGECPVLLWGSRASGEPATDSDYDVFVVLPARRVPFATRRLRDAAATLEERLGVPVSLSPVPRVALDRPQKLACWKLLRESRLLAGAAGFELHAQAVRPVRDAAAFSYLMSAALYLIEHLEPRDLRQPTLPGDVERGVRKALLHTAQLRLLRRGAYASRLEDVLARLDDPVLSGLAGACELPETWFLVRDEVTADLPPRPGDHGLGRTFVTNVQYGALAALAGNPGWRTARTALSTEPVDVRLGAAAVELLEAVDRGGEVVELRLANARHLMPRPLIESDQASWTELRDSVVREWGRAHPLVGL